MRVAFLLLSDHSESINGKLYAMGAGWNMLRFTELPTQHQFGIGFAVDVAWDETNERHELELEIQDPDGVRLGDELTFEIESGRPPGTVPGSDQRLVISLGATIEFSTSGPHAVVIRVGEHELGRSRFYVVETPDAAGP